VNIHGLTTQENLGYKPKAEEDCFLKPSQSPCVEGQVRKILKNSGKMCPHCKPACLLNTYDLQVSQSKMLKERDSNARSDVVIVLSFSTTIAENIVEKASFDVEDFTLYSANVFNLFLGMSIVSFCEFFFQTIMYVIRKCF